MIGHGSRRLVAGFLLQPVMIDMGSCHLRPNEEALIAGSELNTMDAYRRQGCMVVQRLSGVDAAVAVVVRTLARR